MFIIHRFDTTGSMTEDFSLIKKKYSKRGLNSDESKMPFGTWLRNRGVEVKTSIPESRIGKRNEHGDRESYLVEEIHFPSESAFLAFKLKYL